MLPRNALDNPPRCYRALLGTCRIRNALVALLLTGMVALPVENLWANSGERYETILGQNWYIGDNGTASNNKVIIDTTPTLLDAAGGFSHKSYTPKYSIAAKNTLIIKDNSGDVENAYGGYIFLNNGDSSVTYNKTFIIESGKVKFNANGGFVLITGTDSATANYNSLTISSSTSGFSVTENAYGGNAFSQKGKATANYNTLTIEDAGKVKEHASGGFADAPEGEATANYNTLTIEGAGRVESLVRGGDARTVNGDATATGNTVFLNGSSVRVGPIVSGGYVSVDSGSGTVKDNTVVLGASLGADALANVEIYGGFGEFNPVSGTVTVSNNTLEVWGHGLTAGAINNFENLYFILPASIKAGDTVLTITGGDPTKFDTKANVGVAVAAGAQPLKKGDRVTLLKNASGLHNKNDDTLVQGTDYQKVSLEGKTLKGGQGISLEYDFTLSNTATTLDATTGLASIREETKAVVESRVAAAAVLNGAGDLVAFGGMHNALAGFAPQQGHSGMASGDAPDGAIHIIPFAAVSGGWQRIESGSHVNVSGLAALVGLVGQAQFSRANVLAGAFFEYGTSRLDTHNSFASGDVDGAGHASYTGGGILARLDVTESLLRGLYVEGSLRFGGLNSDWHSDDLRDAATGIRAQYDMYAPYVGAHAGLGHVWQATDGLKVDIYGKYFWTRIYGDDTTVAFDPYTFDTMDSQRLRLGARLDWQIAEQASLYMGAAWEHEFNGEARATTYGFDTPAPTMEGDSGVFELGLRWQPTENLKVDLGAVGHVGMRQGIGGNLIVSYTF